MGIPQVIMLCLYGMSLGIAVSKHGEPRGGKHHAGVTAAAVAIGLALLWWGGFFR